ncbi:hypothetical protein EJ04DRAFT_441794, partial [Polyplosphaeria fusca]
LRQALALHRFPAFCAALVGGSTLLQIPVQTSLQLLLHAFSSHHLNTRVIRTVSRFLAALVSASISFRLLNRIPPGSASSTINLPMTDLVICKTGSFDAPPEDDSLEVDQATLEAKSLSRADLAGRTIDLTLFAVMRALDVALSSVLERTKAASPSPRLEAAMKGTPITLFCLSAATIMHAWFYSPARLPQTYNRWISAAAELDRRLLLALRHARYGTWTYGKETGMAPLLGSMCRDYGLPEERGDPAKTIPIPCELVHMGRGKSCEKHALVRFWKGWLFAAKMYTPLQCIVSAFLGAFIAFFYYGVCLSRTRLGPKLFASKTVTPQMWDSGLCVLGGCLFCGTSILFEHQRRRLEILLFVLPRAAATWLPRRYLPEHRWKEHLVFAVSAATVITAAQESPRRVRGVLGKVLSEVLTP